MRKKLPGFTMRTDQINLDKLAYIASYNGRTKNKEMEILLLDNIAAFEEKHGEITPADLEKLANGEKIR